jgi:uncharacterized membrane protein YidH (DUF202 family)
MAEGGIGSPSDYLAAERTFLAWISEPALP